MGVRLPWGLLFASLCALGCGEASQPQRSAHQLPEVQLEASAAPGLAQPLPRGEGFRRGIVLGPLLAPEDDGRWKKEQLASLDRAVARGATDLQLVVQWVQTSASAVEIAPFESVHDSLLTWLVDQAKRRKLRVLLTPRVTIESEAPWAVRGLKPSNWERWWWSYRRIALHYAKFCATRKVAMYGIGSELSSTESQLNQWRKLIKDVRRIYKGKLTYFAAAEGFDKVSFWDALDVVGIAVDQAEPRSEAQLLELLRPLEKRVGRTKARERGYVISESSCGDGASDPTRELLCHKALFQSFSDEARLEGVFLLPGAKTDPRAPDVVRHWFRRSKG